MKWISVEDRLPEIYSPVLGCVADRYSLTGKSSLSIVCYYGIFDGWQALDDEDSLDVTHWMLFPESPAGTYFEYD
jgi:hypothetical protein